MSTVPDDMCDDDVLWRHLKELSYFRALQRAVAARFYVDLDLVEPVLDLGCGDGHFAGMAFADRAPLIGVDPWWGPLREAAQRKVYRAAIQSAGAEWPFDLFACRALGDCAGALESLVR